MSAPAEDLDGAGLLLELLGAVREQGEELRAQRAELRALREALGRRDAKPGKRGRRRVDAPPPSPDPEPAPMTEEDRLRALRLARELGFVVRKP